MATVNPELLRMARNAFEKSAVVPSDAAMMASGAGAPPGAPPMGAAPPGGVAPPMDPAAMGGGAPPMDPAAMGGGAPPPGADPTGAATMAAPPMPAPPPAAPPAAPGAAAAGQQKLKPEQMMQMLDFRMYNMQQILTAIANTLGVQIDPAVLVLPPGTTGAPPAESALPGGPMAPPPPQQDPNAPPGPPAPGSPVPPGGPMDPSQPPPDPNAGKQANWWDKPLAKFAEQSAPRDLQDLAAAAKLILRNL